jgi:hypothetical protein
MGVVNGIPTEFVWLLFPALDELRLCPKSVNDALCEIDSHL